MLQGPLCGFRAEAPGKTSRKQGQDDRRRATWWEVGEGLKWLQPLLRYATDWRVRLQPACYSIGRRRGERVVALVPGGGNAKKELLSMTERPKRRATGSESEGRVAEQDLLLATGIGPEQRTGGRRLLPYRVLVPRLRVLENA